VAYFKAKFKRHGHKTSSFKLFLIGNVLTNACLPGLCSGFYSDTFLLPLLDSGGCQTE
jgi:hypothetical protein